MHKFLLFTVVLLPWLANAQEVHLSFRAEGPGAVITCCPEPNRVGQGYLLIAQPMAGARFVQWEDGSTQPERYFTVKAGQTEFTAFFETVPTVPYLVLHGLQKIDPETRATAIFAQENGRIRLSFMLPGRHGYRVLSTTNLGERLFAPVSFAMDPAEAVLLAENFGDAGPVSVWVDTPAGMPHSFYKIVLDNHLSLPAVYFAQATVVQPGGIITLYGDNLNGVLQGIADATVLTTKRLDDHSVQVTMPATQGIYSVRLKADGNWTLGSVTIRVSSDTNLFPNIDKTQNLTVTSGGGAVVRGQGFTQNMEAFLDSQWVPIVSIASDGTSMVLQIPGNLTGNRQLALVKNGALITVGTLSIGKPDYKCTPGTEFGLHVFSWLPSEAPGFSFTPGSIKGLRVFTYEPSITPVYNFTPGSIEGLRVFTYEPSSAPTFNFIPGSIEGLRVFTYEPSSVPVFNFTPGTTLGLRVQVP